jgi:hypothetical protein
MNLALVTAFTGKTIKFHTEKVSPNSSPDGQFGGGNGAMHGVEQTVEKVAWLFYE